MASASTMIHVRVDEHLKTQATETLAAMGLTVSDERTANRERTE
jgi:DNA-damage-inducible protein J